MRDGGNRVRDGGNRVRDGSNRVRDGLAYTLSSFLPMATCRINQKMAFESDRISALLFP